MVSLLLSSVMLSLEMFSSEDSNLELFLRPFLDIVGVGMSFFFLNELFCTLTLKVGLMFLYFNASFPVESWNGDRFLSCSISPSISFLSDVYALIWNLFSLLSFFLP